MSTEEYGMDKKDNEALATVLHVAARLVRRSFTYGVDVTAHSYKGLRRSKALARAIEDDEELQRLAGLELAKAHARLVERITELTKQVELLQEGETWNHLQSKLVKAKMLHDMDVQEILRLQGQVLEYRSFLIDGGLCVSCGTKFMVCNSCHRDPPGDECWGCHVGDGGGVCDLYDEGADTCYDKEEKDE